jgi:hypothetical protein
MYTTDIEDMSIYFIRSLLTQQKSVQQIAKNIERDFGLLKGCGLSLFKHLVILKTIEIDMKCKISNRKHITLSWRFKGND